MSIRMNATLQITQWNGQQIAARTAAIVEAYGQALEQQLQEEIKTIQFDWPRETKRKNGQMVTSPRDIVDLGGFLRSQELQNTGQTSRRFVWNAPYASTIFSGYTTNRGTPVPGRDWMTPALRALPPARFFAQEWRRLAGGQP